MRVSVVKVLEGEVARWKPDVWLRVQPDGQWVPGSNENPLADVELAVLNNQGVLDVLLTDVLGLLLLAEVEDLHKVSIQHNAAAARAACWLADPDVAFAIDAKLRVLLFEYFKQLVGLLEEWVSLAEFLDCEVVLLLFLVFLLLHLAVVLCIFV